MDTKKFFLDDWDSWTPWQPWARKLCIAMDLGLNNQYNYRWWWHSLMLMFCFFYFQIQQRDIESHSRVVSAVLKLSDNLHDNSLDHEALQTAAHNLEQRWHGIWLQSLEWQCRLEDALSRKKVRVIPLTCSIHCSNETSYYCLEHYILCISQNIVWSNCPSKTEWLIKFYTWIQTMTEYFQVLCKGIWSTIQLPFLYMYYRMGHCSWTSTASTMHL